MDERRKNIRLELNSKLIIKRVDSKESAEVSIAIIDVSKTGIGFACATPLNIGAVYETFLTIWTKEVIHAFIEIVRIEKKEGGYEYGGIFIGMPEMDSQRIEVYQTVSSLQN